MNYSGHLPRPNALSSVYGRIQQVFVVAPHFTGMDHKAENLHARFENLFKVFGDRTTFVILADIVGEEQRAQTLVMQGGEHGLALQMEFEEALKCAHLNPSGGHMIFVPAHLETQGLDGDHRRVWARDAFVVGEMSGFPIIIEPYLSQHPGHRSLAEELASRTQMLIKPSWLCIEGGNLLIGDDYALIGKDLLARNILQLGHHSGKILDLSASEHAKGIDYITREFKQVLGVDHILWVGSDQPERWTDDSLQGQEGHQPLFHLDLFVTLCGMNELGQERVLVADLVVNDDYLKGNWKAKEPELLRLNNQLEKLKGALEKSHTQFNGPEFVVDTLPIGIEVTDSGKLIPYSFNNALVEWYSGVSRITLPEYKSDPRWVEMLKRIKQDKSRYFNRIRSVDFQFDASAASHGSLHCLTQVLKRSER